LFGYHQLFGTLKHTGSLCLADSLGFFGYLTTFDTRYIKAVFSSSTARSSFLVYS